MNNKYYKRSKISEPKFRHLITCVSLDLTATETAELSNISLRSVTVIVDKLRSKIARWCEQSEPLEVDKSYVGPKRIPGKRGRGASDKPTMFGLFKPKGKVWCRCHTQKRSKPLYAGK